MKVFIKISGKYWTGGIKAPEGKLALVMTDKESEAKDFGTIENAHNQAKYGWLASMVDEREVDFIIDRETAFKYPDSTHAPIRDFCKDLPRDVNYFGYSAHEFMNNEYLHDKIFSPKIHVTNNSRTISEICKEADEKRANPYPLNCLKSELQRNKERYSKSEYNFALEHIENHLTELENRHEAAKLKSYFDSE